MTSPRHPDEPDRSGSTGYGQVRRPGRPADARGRPRHQLRRPKRDRARPVLAIVAAVALLAGGGVAVYVVAGEGEDVATGARGGTGGGDQAPTDLSTAQTAARSAVTLLNRKDLDGLVAMTCATGRSEGRRALTAAIPALAGGGPAGAEITFELGAVTEDKPNEAVAELTAHYRDDTGTRADRGEILLVDEVDGWRLCGLSMNQNTAPPLPGPSRGGRPTAPRS
jgi:hypothetical protein